MDRAKALKCREVDAMIKSPVLDLDCKEDRNLDHVEGDVEWDPLLVEQVVFLAIRGTTGEKAYHAAREVCYQEPDLERRNHNFLRLDRDWFVKLNLARPAIDALAEWRMLLSRVQRCILAPSFRRRDGGAELYGTHALDGPKPNLLIRLDVDLFSYPARMRAFMRHELMHIDDILDPEFEYDPSLSQFLDKHGIPNAIRDRYRILWNVQIDGRLSTRYDGTIAPPLRNELEFNKLFRVLDAQCADAFRWILNTPRLTHPEILTFARAPLMLLANLEATR